MERLHTTHRVSRSKATQLAKAETQGHIGLVVLASRVAGLASPANSDSRSQVGSGRFTIRW